MSKTQEIKSKFAPVVFPGFPIAATLSYLKWHSFWYSLGHGLCGWYYVIYFVNQYVYHFIK